MKEMRMDELELVNGGAGNTMSSDGGSSLPSPEVIQTLKDWESPGAKKLQAAAKEMAQEALAVAAVGAACTPLGRAAKAGGQLLAYAAVNIYNHKQ
ncbi:MAG: hypothetical protein Q8N88_01845 [Nanoarchaeota archaeon]|nr:hypothetical protein [Nanoarchaeota archaeon]